MRTYLPIVIALLTLCTGSPAGARQKCDPGPARGDVAAAEKAGLVFDSGEVWRKHMALLEASKGVKYAICVAWEVLDAARKEGGWVNGTSGARARLWLEAHGEEVITSAPRAAYSCVEPAPCC